MFKKFIIISIVLLYCYSQSASKEFGMELLYPKGGETMHIGDTIKIDVLADSSVLTNFGGQTVLYINISLDAGKTFMWLGGVQIIDSMENSHIVASVHGLLDTFAVRDTAPALHILQFFYVIPDSLPSVNKVSSISNGVQFKVFQYPNPSMKIVNKTPISIAAKITPVVSQFNGKKNISPINTIHSLRSNFPGYFIVYNINGKQIDRVHSNVLNQYLASRKACPGFIIAKPELSNYGCRAIIK